MEKKKKNEKKEPFPAASGAQAGTPFHLSEESIHPQNEIRMKQNEICMK